MIISIAENLELTHEQASQSEMLHSVIADSIEWQEMRI